MAIPCMSEVLHNKISTDIFHCAFIVYPFFAKDTFEFFRFLIDVLCLLPEDLKHLDKVLRNG